MMIDKTIEQIILETLNLEINEIFKIKNAFRFSKEILFCINEDLHVSYFNNRIEDWMWDPYEDYDLQYLIRNCENIIRISPKTFRSQDADFEQEE